MMRISVPSCHYGFMKKAIVQDTLETESRTFSTYTVNQGDVLYLAQTIKPEHTLFDLPPIQEVLAIGPR